jgi:cytochrome c-type biogenesis protein
VVGETSHIGPLAAFAAGVASFLSPCVLPLVPGYVSYIAGTASQERTAVQVRSWPPLALAALFVAGFATVFISLGATASAAAQFLLQYRQEATVAGGLVIMLFGLLMLGVLDRVTLFQRDVRWNPQLQGGRPAAAYGLGLAFGFGWTPCIGPVLGAILTVAAVSTDTGGVALLAIYSVGLGVPFLLAAAFTERMVQHQHLLRRISRPVQRAAGAIMVLMGAFMATGHLAEFSFWLLRAVPWFSRVG